MDSTWTSMKAEINRRSFIRNGISASVAAASAGVVVGSPTRLAEEDDNEHHGRLSRGVAALLRFAAAAEILETDFWVQYNELGGVPDKEVPGGSGNPAYTAALSVLDSDMAQYIHDNTDDEFTHQNFLNAYLRSKGEEPVSLEQFRTLEGSTATGSSGKMRLTNLMRLTLDTSWWTRYRSSDHNPDLDPHFTFPQAIPSLAVGE
ncbi:MAG: ferritin-like domain-containing protein, partial [Candidatus Angelobacter sp.]